MSWDHDGYTYFKSDDPGKTIKSEGVEFKNIIIFNGNGSWTLLDGLQCKYEVSLKKGTWNTNGKRVRVGRFKSDEITYLRTLILGTTSFHLSYSGEKAWEVNGINLTLQALQSFIYFDGISGGMKNVIANNLQFNYVEFTSPFGTSKFLSESATYNKVFFRCNAVLVGPSTFYVLQFSAGRSYELPVGFPQIIIDSLIADGNCEGFIYIYSSTATVNAIISKTLGSIQLHDVIMRDITALGGASFYAYHSVDIGNNLGWVFTLANGVNHYWVKGPGNWDDTSHWSYTSGGPGGACVPTAWDNVFFDANSFTGQIDTIVANVTNAFCNNMTWAGFTETPVFIVPKDNNLRIFGSLWFAHNMNSEIYGCTYFESKYVGKEVLSAGQIFNNHVYFRGGGEWTLMDSLSIEKQASYLILECGILNVNQQVVTAAGFSSILTSAIRQLNMKKAKFLLYASTGNPWKVYSQKFNIQADSSNIYIYSSFDFYHLGSLDTIRYWNLYFANPYFPGRLYSKDIYPIFHKVHFLSNGYIDGNHFYDSLIFTKGKKYYFYSQKVQTFRNLVANGDCNNKIGFQAFGGTGQSYVRKKSGNLLCSYLELKDMATMGGLIYYVAGGVDLGNNIGWTIIPPLPVTLYWVGDGGRWNDP